MSEATWGRVPSIREAHCDDNFAIHSPSLVDTGTVTTPGVHNGADEPIPFVGKLPIKANCHTTWKSLLYISPSTRMCKSFLVLYVTQYVVLPGGNSDFRAGFSRTATGKESKSALRLAEGPISVLSR